jgi:AraC family transcriptional regulator of adaptative response/methylated-DNA-[protein]-cysteine methyltransferase
MLRTMEEPMNETRPAAAGRKADSLIETVRRACRFIESRVDGADESAEGVSLTALGRHCGVSPWHLQRQFKKVMGVSPRQYADARRLKRFKAGLQQGTGVAAATYDAGYGSSSRVYERAADALGMTPATYARGGRGARIRFSLGQSPLGRLLVATTVQGICFVGLGDRDDELEKVLHAEFPSAVEIKRDDSALKPGLSAILDHLRGRTPHIELPLDIRATAFQRRVWEELRRIPSGETRSYGEIAVAMGRPKAQRAVGRACAANPVAVVVPCHRAVRTDGAVGGYRWGAERKNSLLRSEQRRSARS